MGRGGRRPGAGRKPNPLKRLVIRAGDLARLSREELQFLDADAIVRNWIQGIPCDLSIAEVAGK